MQLNSLKQFLDEMAKAGEYCSNCGFPKTGVHPTIQLKNKKGQMVNPWYHRYAKGGYKCNPALFPEAQRQGFAPKGTDFKSAGTTPPTPPNAPGAAPAASPAAPAPAPTAAPAAPTQQPQNQTAAKKAALENWLSGFDVGPNDYQINNDRLDINKDISIDDEVLPVPFGVINGTFQLTNPNLSSFENTPRVVKGDFVATNTRAESMDGLDIEVDGDVDFSGNEQIKDLSNIHNHFKRIDGELIVDFAKSSKGGIGIMLIKGLESVGFDDEHLESMFNKYLEGDRDLLDLQEELIDAGYQKHARLSKRSR